MNYYIFAIDICHQPNEHWYAVHMGTDLMDAIQKLLDHENQDLAECGHDEDELYEINTYISDGFIDMAIEIIPGAKPKYYQQVYNTDIKGYELKETYIKSDDHTAMYPWPSFKTE
jgi:hypothetical protein